MRNNKQMNLIEEAPLVAVGFAVAAVGALAYATALGTSRAVLYLTHLDRRAPAAH
ncbi:MAG: hypothetical protein M3Z57_01515 [Candidatus Dormibacteraeota bacterium]|nr:hypothetical protein [Candidatus Dormibacteraeota bacterium]